MKQKITLLVLFLSITLTSCVHESFRAIENTGEKVSISFSPSSTLTQGNTTNIYRFRMLAFNSIGKVEINKTNTQLATSDENNYILELRPGMYTLYGIGNEPSELKETLNNIQSTEELDKLYIGDVRKLGEEELPLFWKKTIYVRAKNNGSYEGEVSLDNKTDWTAKLDMKLERMAAKISINICKDNANETIQITSVQLCNEPLHTTFYPSIYPLNDTLSKTTYNTDPIELPVEAGVYKTIVNNKITAENIPATEERKNYIFIALNRNGITEEVKIPFDGNLKRNTHYQYNIKIKVIGIEIENMIVKPWDQEMCDVVIPGVELNLSRVDVPYSFGQESKVYFTTKNIHPDNLNLSSGLYSEDGAHVVGNLYDYFDTSTQYTYSYDPATRTGRGELTIKRKKPTLEKHRINIYASGITRSILVNGLEVAGSNIYWDSTHNRLAFDDVPKDGEYAPHEKYQGIPFNWGALQAYSSGYFSNRKKNIFIWAATGDIRDSSKDIKYKMQTGHKRFIFAPNLGFGDICLYMTRRGWSPAGKKWRMPRYSELNSVKYIQEGEFGATADHSMPADGTGEVRSGVRINKYYLPYSGFTHRTSTYTYNNQVNKRTFYGVHDRPSYNSYSPVTAFYDLDRKSFLNYGLNTYYGYFIRCVVDDEPGAITPLYVVSYDLSESKAGTITVPTPEGIILNQHVDAGGNIILSDIKLTSSMNLNHTGWLIDGKKYKLGASISNIQKDYVAKPIWMTP